MRIIHVPLEKLPNRYTADWQDQFRREFQKAQEAGLIDDFVFVVGQNNEQTINSGSVLDACGTNIYKLDQLKQLIELIQCGAITENDVIFFADAWCPGIESLFYVRNITGIDFKIAGILHAGLFDPEDFTNRFGMRDWGQHIELGWLHGLDMIFVATKWCKDLIVMNSDKFDEDKIFVTGLPFYATELRQKYPVTEKEDIVVFPHRMDPEKQPEKFEALKRKFPQWKFVYTIQETKNRDEYFKLLAKSKVMVSFAKQETFGYSTLEAMALGNYVIVPNDLSYRETVPREYRYKNEREVPEMLEKFMASTEIPVYPDLVKWEKSIHNMIRVMNVKMREFSKRRKERQAQIQEEFKRISRERKERRKRALEAKEEAGKDVNE